MTDVFSFLIFLVLPVVANLLSATVIISISCWPAVLQNSDHPLIGMVVYYLLVRPFKASSSNNAKTVLKSPYRSEAKLLSVMVANEQSHSLIHTCCPLDKRLNSSQTPFTSSASSTSKS
jgi:hypothetical protein